MFIKDKYEQLDNFREKKEDEIVNLLEKIANNKTYKSAKTKGARILVKQAILVGIKLAESSQGTTVNIDDDVVNGVANKGGDVLTKAFDWLISLFKRFLRRKSKGYKKRNTNDK